MHCHGDVYRCSCSGREFSANFAYDRIFQGFKAKQVRCVFCGKEQKVLENWKAEPRQVTEWDRLGINRRTWFRRLARERAKAIGERAE